MATALSIYSKNGAINPKLGTALTGYVVATGTGPGVSTNVRMTDGNLVIPETGQVITAYQRITWTTAPTDLISCGSIYGGPGVDQAVIVGGKINTISAYHRTSHADRVMNFIVTLHDVSNTQLALVTGPAFAVGGSSFVRMSVALYAPPTAVRAYIRFYPKSVGGGTNYVNGDTIDTTGMLVEQSENLNPYFDGDTVIAGNVFGWLSTANGSVSTWSKPYTTDKNDDIYASLLGTYGPGSLVDMEYKRLLAANALSAPQKLSLYDLYKMAGERPRIY